MKKSEKKAAAKALDETIETKETMTRFLSAAGTLLIYAAA